ncbi:uncharacterized protein LOC131635401 [Vicia villosa]|uniref:uncharacterized protein LOC131635401 n=1 Tax=Vicia villosa TaxID=3911 RepID=UPI00273B4F02|nr:uncharacterized protein LOC131635401 [Vicia villosa]
MIIGSFNIRGGGNLIKRKRIAQIVKNGKEDIFLIQESKLETVDVGIVNSLWPNEKVGLSFSGSSGASGGLITIWKEGVCEVLFSFRGEGFIGIKVIHKGLPFYIVNVYSPCTLQLKRKLWKDLLQCKSYFTDGEWCIAGDFNVVVCKRERRGSGSRSRTSEMKDFAEFILHSNLIDVQCKGKRYSWFSGGGLSMSRIDRFLLSDSLILEWGISGQRIDNRDVSDHCPIWLISDFSDWGPKPFRVNDCWFEDSSFLPFVEKVWRSIKVEGRSDFILKEKLRILKSSLRIWNEEQFGKFDLDIREGIQKINLADSLLSSCQEDSIKEVVIERSEATSEMWKKMYIKENLLRQKSRDFHKYGRLSKAIISSFLTLIPKCDNPLGLDEFRPICLVGCVYKVISKLLASRLKRVLDPIVSVNQSAFVPGRLLLDGVLVANEVVDHAKKSKQKCLMFKVDFEKAYDSVSWIYLKSVMNRMGFGIRWMKWMDATVFSSWMSVLVNGSATRDFKVDRGLRQGDPLSPFLFVLAAEGLAGLVNKVLFAGEYCGYKMGRECVVDLL